MSTMGDKGAGGEEDELNIPRAALNKMVKEIASTLRVTNDARELILACSKEFIHLVSSEANDICNKSMKKTITTEHILSALDKLGFGSYKAEAEACGTEAKQVASNRRRKSIKLEHLDTEAQEELLRKQKELFAEARQEQATEQLRQWEEMRRAASLSQSLQLPSQSTSSTAPDDPEDYH